MYYFLLQEKEQFGWLNTGILEEGLPFDEEDEDANESLDSDSEDNDESTTPSPVNVASIPIAEKKTPESTARLADAISEQNTRSRTPSWLRQQRLILSRQEQGGDEAQRLLREIKEQETANRLNADVHQSILFNGTPLSFELPGT